MPSGLVNLAAVVVVLAGLRAAAPIAVPVLLALFLAFVSAPLVFWLRDRRRVPYPLAVALVLLLEGGLLVSVGFLVARSATRLQVLVPGYRDRLGDLYEASAQWLTERGVEVQNESLTDLLDPSALTDLVASTVTEVTTALSRMVLVILVLAFALFDSARLFRTMEGHLARKGHAHVLERISSQVNRYLGVKTITSAATGLLLGLWCRLLGVDFALPWGLLAFLLNYVPTVGSILAAVPPVMISLLVLGPGNAMAVTAGYLAVNFAIGNVLEPRVFGQVLGISPVVVLLSIVLWGWLLGPIGALISVPLTMVFKIAMAESASWSWLADLMSGGSPPVRPSTASTEPPLSPPD